MIFKICRLVCEWFYSISFDSKRFAGKLSNQTACDMAAVANAHACKHRYVCFSQAQVCGFTWLYLYHAAHCHDCKCIRQTAVPMPAIVSRWRSLHGALQACIPWLHDHGLHGNHLHDINCPLWQCAIIIGGNGFFSRHCRLRCSTRCRRHKVHQRRSWEENTQTSLLQQTSPQQQTSLPLVTD